MLGQRICAVMALMMAAICSVAVAQPDVQWTFDAVGFDSYVLDSFSPPEADLGPINGEDPTLTLVIGTRYQVTIVEPELHPLEILAKSELYFNDVVLLSMEYHGSMEDDPEIDWVELGDSVEFTLTTALAEAMQAPGNDGLSPGYRCSLHLSEMRGDFIIIPEPASAFLLGSGAALLIRRRRS